MKSSVSTCILAVAIILCIVQPLWFGRKCFNQIDYDGMAYTGIARHIHEGQFRSSINAFRSPLISWVIAAFSFACPDYLHIGKLVNLGSYLLLAALLYVFTEKLWHSRLAAALALLLFVIARGLVVTTIEMVIPDFLFGVLVLVYFIGLLNCLRHGRTRDWFLLGVIHGVAFLAKAFALPWLALCTLVASVLSTKSWPTRVSRVAAAALIPVIVAGAWATVLHSKYGVFTTGTQFKSNLLQWTLHAYRDHRGPTYAVLRDTTKEVDDYLVDDPMPPGSWPWRYPVYAKQVVPKLLHAEAHNIPQVVKEITITVTPGGVLAFIAALAIVTRRRNQYPLEWRMVMVIAVSAISLVCAYSMLVFDSRYLDPLLPLILAVAARFLVPDAEWNHNVWRSTAIALVVLGSIASVVYPSSPFRLLTRDFQIICYDAGRRLKAHDGSDFVTIGSGPFPEHGVGWEAGYKAAYFGNRKLVAALDELPNPAQAQVVLRDLAKASPDAILVWRDAQGTRYPALVKILSEQYPRATSEEIVDPVLGSVGVVFFVDRTKPQ